MHAFRHTSAMVILSDTATYTIFIVIYTHIYTIAHILICMNIYMYCVCKYKCTFSESEFNFNDFFQEIVTG